MESIRVLYVEDDQADRELTRRHLERHAPQFRLSEAGSVAEALNRLAAGDVDLVLADYHLPDGTGLELLETIREKAFRVPVVLVTGSRDVETAVRLLRAGAVDYVVKRPGYLVALPAVLEGAFRWFQSTSESRATAVRVLYAEDDPVHAELTQWALREHEHFHLEVVRRGGEALERLRTGRYDLLLLDYHLPDLSGIEILKALREERIKVPVVIVTGQGDEETAVQAFKLGAADYILKGQRYLARLPSIMENVLARRRLAAEKEKFEKLLEAAPDAMVVVNKDGRIVLANSQAKRSFGYTAEELLGQPVEILVPERFREYFADPRVRPSEVGLDVYALRKDGQEFPVEISLSPLETEEGTLLISAIRDITGRKRAQEALRASEARTRSVIETANDAFIAIDANGAITDWNRRAEATFGWSRDEIIGRPLSETIIPPQHREAHLRGLQRFLDTGEGPVLNKRIELTAMHRDGHEFPVEITIWPNRVENRYIFNAFVHDITERKRAEEVLRQTEKLAAMGQLMAGVAHELNNPLSVVVGQTAMLAHAIGEGPAAERAAKIAQAAERCARIVRNFLALARQQPPERRRVALNEVIQEAVELLAYPLQVDSVELRLDLAGDAPVLWADPNQLHQVAVNLIINAHHAMRETPPPRRLTLTTRSLPGRARIVLEVADTGPGIPPEIQARMFEPFFTTKPLGQGTGLGLSLCLGIIEAHGGSIQVESLPGQGTLFRIELPVQAPPVEEAPPEALPPLQARTILVVDDESMVADVLADILSTDGHQVETATNGVVALDKIGKRAYDLIMSDIKMPGLDGPSFYRELERRYPGCLRRCIFITGDILNPETRKFLEQTGVPSLGKPFSLDEIRRVIREVLPPSDAGL